MTRQEYEEKLADLQSQIDELKKANIEEECPQPPHQRWKPDKGGSYYAIGNSDFGFYPWTDNGWSACIWSDGPEDEFNYAIGRVCHTEKEALEEIERLKVLAEMREWTGNWNDPWYLRFFDGNIAVNERILTTMNLGELRFACKDDAENCIRVVGEDRIKKYYFGIPDDEKEKEN